MLPDLKWADRFLADHLLPGNEGKPLCLVHPWNSPAPWALPVAAWDEWIARWNTKLRFWQLGRTYDSAVQGCEYYELGNPRSRRHSVRMLSLMSRAVAFVGVPCDAMSMALELGLPTLDFSAKTAELDRFLEQALERKSTWQRPSVP
jgi:hypothetical protein